MMRTNNDKRSAWLLAARAGSVGSLGVFSTYIPAEVLDRGCDLTALHMAGLMGQSKAVRFLVETL
jgi:hypothetical protein